MSRELSLQGYILKSQDIGEQDVLLTFFSLEEGKVRVMVKSAKKLTSRLAGRIQPTAKLEIILAGNGSLPKLIGVTVQNNYPDITLSEDRIAALMVLQEYANRALADAQPNEQLFWCYGQALTQLGSADYSQCLEVVTRFVVQTLTTIGLAPRLLNQSIPANGGWLSFDDGSFVIRSGLGQQSPVESEVYSLYTNLYQNSPSATADSLVWQKLLKLMNNFGAYQLERQLNAAQYFFQGKP